SRTYSKGVPGLETSNPNHQSPVSAKGSIAVDMSTPIGMSRREREAAEKEAAKQRYWKLHQAGKTDEAKADMARLAVIRKQREEAAARREAEAK
ncbi:heat- and acid-stable phosphoprotein, partial [Mortierella alpina]